MASLRSRRLVFVGLIVCLASAGRPLRAWQEVPRVSEFGRYEGWSEALFDGWATSSLYVTMRDGVRLAVDVTRPTFYGELVEEPFPVVWTHSRYHRRPPSAVPSRLSMVDGSPALQRLVQHGYVVASAAVRGSGASFGRYEGLFSPAETDDAAELIAWFAAQPWCDGNVGMWGGSYLGITQYMAASRAPPALKAIFPDVAAFDMYDLVYAGGIFRECIGFWDEFTRRLDRELLAQPVDADVDGRLLHQAVAAHEENWQVAPGYVSAPFRDDVVPGLAWKVNGPSGLLPAIQEAGIPAYHINGWFDVFTIDATLWWANTRAPEHLTIGPWAHAGIAQPGVDEERQRVTTVEQHRWFDRWLKGIENGIDQEPGVHYALIEEPGRWRWVASPSWPPPEARPQRFFLRAGPSGSVASRNDGSLAREEPTENEAFDRYAVDPTTTTGTSSRWDNAVGAVAQVSYPHLAENDALCLTYTTEPLEKALSVVGHPLVRLFLDADHEDCDVFALLEEVGPGGDVRYVTEGCLRASRRALAEAPWNNLGLPWQSGLHADAKPLVPGEPVELVFDLQPIANVFDAGHRLRLTLMGADAHNARALPGAEDTNLRVWRDEMRPSGLELPIVP